MTDIENVHSKNSILFFSHVQQNSNFASLSTLSHQNSLTNLTCPMGRACTVPAKPKLLPSVLLIAANCCELWELVSWGDRSIFSFSEVRNPWSCNQQLKKRFIFCCEGVCVSRCIMTLSPWLQNRVSAWTAGSVSPWIR